MPLTAALAVVFGLESDSEEHFVYVDTQTGAVEFVMGELLRKAEEWDPDSDQEPDFPEWQKPVWEVAKQLVSSDRYIPLPNRYAINCAFHGRGPFRRFKDVLHRHNLQQDWYAFRENALRQIGIDFCEENDLAWK